MSAIHVTYFIIICQKNQQRTKMGSHTDKKIIRPFEILFYFFLFQDYGCDRNSARKRRSTEDDPGKNGNPLLTYNASVVKSIASATYLFK